MEENLTQSKETSTSSPSAPAKEGSQVYALLSYLGILVLVPLLAKKDDQFVKFHVKQGLVLFIGEIIWFFMQGILFFILRLLMVFINPLVWLGFVILSILGIINVLQNKEKELPVVGIVAKKFKF